ncbi:glycosyltransferase, partial [Microvirga sp. 3-52]|nr:glycosyltransferase [Microvirga sp. 3-52]
AIESFLMQKTNFDFEILIGEDCSTDNTKKIVEGYAEKHPGTIRIITSEKNVGARKNSIRLLENSRGKYIAECEGDDYWTDPYKLQKQVDYMVEHPDCSMTFHASEIIKAPNKQAAGIIKPYKTNGISPIEDTILRGGGFFSTGSM